MRERAERHPPVLVAILADTRYACAYLSRPGSASRLRLAGEALRLTVTHDGFVGLLLYRVKARLRARRVPLLPHLLHRLAIMSAGVAIGDAVIVEPGIYLPHGQVVVDGLVTIGTGTAIRPWVTIGLLEGDVRGPTIGRNVQVGTGAKIVGPITVGDGALVGANAVVIEDVPARSTVAGVPGRIVRTDRPPGESNQSTSGT
jgi:serine O-acetyltransferase